MCSHFSSVGSAIKEQITGKKLLNNIMDYLNHLYGRNIKRIKEIDDGTIHKIKTHNQGVCYITTYRIFSGVSVMFNDIHASKFEN